MTVTDPGRKPESWVPGFFRALAWCVVAGVTLVTTAAALRQAVSPHDERYEPYPEFPRVVDVVRAKGRGGPILVLSNNIRAAFPLVNYSGVKWGSRINAVWMLGAAYGDLLRAGRPLEYHSPTAMTPAERFVNQVIATDMERMKPTLLIVERPLPAGLNPIRRLDYLAFFTRDSRFAESFTQYRLLAEVGDYRVFARARSVGK